MTYFLFKVLICRDPQSRISIGPWPGGNQSTQQEMSGGRNQKLHLPHWSMEKLSSMKLVSGAKEVADCCSNVWNQCQLLKNTSFWITETFYPVLRSQYQWEWCQILGLHLRYQIHMPSGHCLELNPKTKSSDVLSNSGLGAARLLDGGQSLLQTALALWQTSFSLFKLNSASSFRLLDTHQVERTLKAEMQKEDRS